MSERWVRLLAGGLMTLAGAGVGFLAGGLLASRLTGAGAALTDAATVAVAAVGGALLVAAAAIAVARRASRSTLLLATLVLLVTAAVLATAVRRPGTSGAPATDATGAAVATAPPLAVTGGDSLLGLMRLGTAADGSELLPVALDLRGGPGEAAPVLTTVTRWSDLVTEEIGYEEPAIAVFRVAHPWFLVATRDSVLGWARLPEGATVVPLVELLPDRLTYLTASWDGMVRASPAAGSPTAVTGIVRDHGEASAEVHEARQVGDALWLRVSVHRESPCEAAGEVDVVAGGWVPAWTNGKPTAWYYSRGC